MAITLRNSIGSENGTGGTSILMTMPTVSDNDVLIMQITVRGGTGTTITTPSGWSILSAINNGTSLQQVIYWKIASSEPGSYSISITSNKATGTISSFYNASSTIPSSTQYSGQANTSASTTVSASALGTYSSHNGMDLFLGGLAFSSTGDVPSGYTLGSTIFSSGGGPNSSKSTSDIGYAYLTSSTTVGSLNATFSASAVSIGHHVFIFETNATINLSIFALLGVG